MASTKVDPPKAQESADADDESVFTDSEEEEGELQLGRRDVASDDEGEAEEGELRGDQAASAGDHHLYLMSSALWIRQTMQDAKYKCNEIFWPSLDFHVHDDTLQLDGMTFLTC